MSTHWIWLDLEMTGLVLPGDTILEISVLVTDSALTEIAVGPELAIHQPESVLNRMGPWCQAQHTKSGLVARVRESTETMQSAEEKVLAFLKEHVKPGASPLCGNSVHQDRRFLERYMPRLENYFHYRNLDVSTVKILAHEWAPPLKDALKKESAHRALEDIRESIAELQFYRERGFVG